MENETVFIVGCARTGSTLLRKILNQSERITITSETHFLRRLSHVGLWKRLQQFGDLSDDHNAGKLVDYMYSNNPDMATGYWGLLKREIDYQSFKQRLLETDRSERAIFNLLMQTYAEHKKGAITPELVLGEKTPTHLYYVPTLLEWYPNAKVIHTFRDPRGIFVSTLKRVQEGKWGLKAKYPALPAKVVAPLNTPTTMLYITKTWLDAVRLHARYAQMYPERYRLVRFEDLLVDPENQIKQVCDFLQVPFERTMVDDVVVIGSSYQAQRRGPSGFDQNMIDRWQAHIDPFVKAYFSILGRKHLKRFGYMA